jgi:aspartate/methionine/tyrosine aminotransferase
MPRTSPSRATASTATASRALQSAERALNAASRLDEVSSFQAVEIFQAAQALEAQGRSVIHLEFGEPDFDTPQPVREAAVRALAEGRTHYVHSMGIPAFREAIAAFHRSKYGVEVHPDQILVSMGTSLIMQLVMLLLLEPGDEVMLTDPCYACYANFVRLAGGRPRFVPIREEEGFQPDPDAIRRAIGPRTRAVMIGSPANPTGVVLKPEAIRALAALPVPVISDEIYHGLTYAGEERSLLEFTDRGFVLNGFSKYFAMTGWRLGYLIFPRELLASLMKLHQNVMISANDFMQYAGIAALTEAIPFCEGYKAEYDRRRRYMIQRLGEIGLPLRYEPAGAFYCFADARRYLRKDGPADSLALARDILQRAGVAVTPGIDFGPGGEGYLRFSYANSMENIREGLGRIEEYLRGR